MNGEPEEKFLEENLRSFVNNLRKAPRANMGEYTYLEKGFVNYMKADYEFVRFRQS